MPVKFTADAPVSFQVPPLLIVTFPPNDFVPVLASVNVPSTVVAPVTDSVQALLEPVANVLPLSTPSVPPTETTPAVVFVPFPLVRRFPYVKALMVCVADAL